jgi:hypothetical protein
VGEKVNEVLKYFLVSVSSSGMEPPIRYVFVSEAIALRAWKEGDCSFVGGEGRRVSAYLVDDVLADAGAWRVKEGYKRREIIAAIGTIEAFWQHYYLCTSLGGFVYFLSCMRQIRRFVRSCPHISISTKT